MTVDFIAQKLITPSDLPGWSKDSDEMLIWTNGCFDIIHAGHITYLNACKKLGGILMVGLNSDESVRRLKGPERPIIHQEDRVLHLAAFSFVDYVVVFEEDTPLECIRAVEPDVLVKGGDYRVEDIVGFREVTNSGGRVLTIPLVEGKSTSAIIDRIKNDL